MLVAKESITTSASRESVWKIWSDVSNWPQWDHSIQKCEFRGEFKEGAEAVLHPKSGPKTNVKIVDFVYKEKFTTISNLPLWSSITFKHKLKSDGDSLKITHRVDFHGCLAPVLNFFIGGSIKSDLSLALKSLVQRAEKTH